MPSDKQLELQRTYQNVLHAPKAIPIDGSAYHARMHKLVALLAEKMKTKTDPAFVCKDAVAKTGDWAAGVITPGPGGLTPAMTDGYLAFERELVKCAPNLSVDFAAESATLMDAAVVVIALDAAGFDTTDGIPGRTSLEAILTATKAKSGLMDTDEAEMREKLRAGKIGLYTTEQEADDISLDIATKLGITAGEMLGGWIKFMRAVEETGVKFGETESGDLGSVKCKALLDANFTEPGPDGKPVPAAMTLGSLESRHHGECYRAYNLWRENNGHKYQVTEAFTPPAGPDWAELALEAAKLSGMVPSTEKTPPADATTPPEDIAPADLPQVHAAEEAAKRGPIDYPRNATTGCNAGSGAPGSSAALLAAALALVIARRRRR
jgi:MYXO-CTERM domain-containing protein